MWKEKESEIHRELQQVRAQGLQGLRVDWSGGGRVLSLTIGKWFGD